MHIIFHIYVSFTNSYFKKHFVYASQWLGIHIWLKNYFIVNQYKIKSQCAFAESTYLWEVKKIPMIQRLFLTTYQRAGTVMVAYKQGRWRQPPEAMGLELINLEKLP